jgi:hypothetical protein
MTFLTITLLSACFKFYPTVHSYYEKWGWKLSQNRTIGSRRISMSIFISIVQAAKKNSTHRASSLAAKEVASRRRKTRPRTPSRGKRGGDEISR